MRKIADIYEEYKIMPNLQIHQLRVAAVAAKVCDSLDIPVDKDAIVTACLFHDMGNIIKFKLGYFPEFLEPEGLDYWETVKREYIEKYGENEHIATIAIAREFGIGADIIKNMEAIEFSNWCAVNVDENWSQKICTYADARVGVTGIISLEERLEDGERRYKGIHEDMDAKRLFLQNCMRTIEKEISSRMKIAPEDITDESISPYIEELKNFSLA
ncbi:MAG: HD domain-containing protein [Patescibacteria group bacterium]